MSDWVTYHMMPYEKPGVNSYYSLNTYGKGHEMLPVIFKPGLYLSCENIDDVSGQNLVEVYYEWFPLPWKHYRICSGVLFFARFNPFFVKSILVEYKTEKVRYRIAKKKYLLGEFVLTDEYGGELFRFSEKGYDREGQFKESVYKVDFRYKTQAEKLFFLGLFVCIPNAIELADPSTGGT